MQSFWWSALLPLLRFVAGSDGEEKGEKVTGVLGESVTFRLEFSEPFETISWLSSSNVASIAVLSPGENCPTLILNPDFKGRLNVSEDCKRIQLQDLDRDDSGTYEAQIQLWEKKELLKLLFRLHVYKRLSESDLSLRCQEIGNGTRRVNCSAEPWEDGATFRISTSDRKDVAGRSFDVQRDLEEGDLNITCEARNPVSAASRTEPLEDICAERTPAGSTTEPDSENENGPPRTSLSAAIVGVVVALSAVVAFVVAFFCWKKRKADSMEPPSGSADSGGCNTIYARVGDVVQDRDPHYSRPRTQPSKPKPKTAQTIYSTVDHACKPNPLQTDDEKAQKRSRRAADPREKTIYSEIATEPQEDEDPSLKAVYETVKNPKGPEYDQIL